jgi:hypothetical protein
MEGNPFNRIHVNIREDGEYEGLIVMESVLGLHDRHVEHGARITVGLKANPGDYFTAPNLRG